ncbi:unnamed protein product [Effrenium voratum]|nr:unnamed protein product [Effrenium voratum]
MPTEDGYKLFVGSLPIDCTSDELYEVFSTYGVVTHVHVMNPHPQSGQRCAFVFYSTKSAGDYACSVLDNQYRIRTNAAQPIVVRWAKDDSQNDVAKGNGKGEWVDGPRRPEPPDGHKLFIGGLPADVTDEELRIVFGTYGKVVHCHIMGVHPKSGLRCAFVYFKDFRAAEGAIKVLDNKYKIRQKAVDPIQVRWANTDGDRGKGEVWDRDWGGNGKSFGKGKDFSDPWFPKGKGKGWHPEDRLWEKGWQDKGWTKGWEGPSWMSWQGDWSGWSMNGKGKGWKGPPPVSWSPGTKLYVANLPDDIQEGAIEYVFSTYGTVDKVHLMTGKVKNGCISAFVEFRTPDEANTAIKSLDNKYEIRAGYGPLQVRHANSH